MVQWALTTLKAHAADLMAPTAHLPVATSRPPRTHGIEAMTVTRTALDDALSWHLRSIAMRRALLLALTLSGLAIAGQATASAYFYSGNDLAEVCEDPRSKGVC